MHNIIINQLEFCKKNNIFFWGASKFLKEFINNNDLTKYKIIGIIDSNKSKSGNFFAGYKIFSLDEILNHKAKIIFTIKNNHSYAYKSVYNELKAIKRHNSLLDDPFFEFENAKYVTTNKIYLVDKMNNKYPISAVPGLTVEFLGGGNSILEIGHPMPNFTNSSIIFNGSNNIIRIGSSSQALNNLQISFFNNNSTIKIGENFCCLATKLKVFGNGDQITIGDDCILSNDIEMRTSDGHSIFDKKTKKRINLDGNITIGNHVWIAQGVLIFKNSNIPDDCVVGARSLVNKKFTEKNCIIAGVPAKIVKRNIEWKRELV